MRNGKRCILVVDDEERIVRALTDVLSVKGFSVLSAPDGEQALETFYKYASQIDLVLLDVMLPKRGGFEVLLDLRESGSLVPVIMLTARGEEYDQIKGFRYGSDDYITKPFSPTVLIARIEAVLRRVGKGDNCTLSDGNLSVNILTHEVTDGGEPIELTRREFDLLCYFMTNPHLVLTREQLLNGIWGYDYIGDERTVDTHIKQLRAKLPSGNYIKTVYRLGYKFESDI